MSNELESGIADVAFGKDEVGADSAARPADWRTYLATGPLASAEFMDGVDDLATQERDPNGS